MSRLCSQPESLLAWRWEGRPSPSSARGASRALPLPGPSRMQLRGPVGSESEASAWVRCGQSGPDRIQVRGPTPLCCHRHRRPGGESRSFKGGSVQKNHRLSRGQWVRPQRAFQVLKRFKTSLTARHHGSQRSQNSARSQPCAGRGPQRAFSGRLQQRGRRLREASSARRPTRGQITCLRPSPGIQLESELSAAASGSNGERLKSGCHACRGKGGMEQMVYS